MTSTRRHTYDVGGGHGMAVLDGRGRVIPGFYVAGNATGDRFYDNYPDGTGLTNAAVFGKRAAEGADDSLE